MPTCISVSVTRLQHKHLRILLLSCPARPRKKQSLSNNWKDGNCPLINFFLHCQPNVFHFPLLPVLRLSSKFTDYPEAAEQWAGRRIIMYISEERHNNNAIKSLCFKKSSPLFCLITSNFWKSANSARKPNVIMSKRGKSDCFSGLFPHGIGSCQWIFGMESLSVKEILEAPREERLGLDLTDDLM